MSKCILCILFYSHFTKCLKVFGIGFVLVQTCYLNPVESFPQDGAPLINLKRFVVVVDGSHLFEIKRVGRERCSFLTGRGGLVRPELQVKNLRLAFSMPI